MIYLFYGTDIQKVREKAFAWVAVAQTKEPSLVYIRLARENITSATLEQAASAGGLFVRRLLVLIDDPFPVVRVSAKEDGDSASDVGADSNVIDEYLDILSASDNAIVILAPKLASAKAKKLSAKAKVEYVYDIPKDILSSRGRGFNGNLVNALASRSREKLWTEIHRALRAGDAPEMLHGLLHWKARDLMEKGGRAWSQKEARTLSLSLITLLQESRRGGLDLSLSLEKFALSVCS